MISQGLMCRKTLVSNITSGTFFFFNHTEIADRVSPYKHVRFFMAAMVSAGGLAETEENLATIFVF